jgi:K(+)-stimulated pyrophosphate-energized sodium pump
LARYTGNETVGSLQMVKGTSYIQEGTKAFIKRQHRTIAVFVALSPTPLGLFLRDLRVVVSFGFGTPISLLAAYVRSRVVVEANVRYVRADC